VFEKYPHIHTWIARGNCDTNPEIEEKIQKLKNVTCQEVIHLELIGVHIGASHIQGIAQNRLKNKPIEIFCHGHTHRQKIEKQDGKIILNPGALTEDGTYFLVSIPDLTLQKHVYTDVLK
jgi:predicted phosphodiesterase